MMALANDSPLDTEPILSPESRCRTTVLITADGLQHLLFQDRGRSLQLAVSGASVLAPVRLLTDAVLPERGRAARLAALDSFNVLRVSGRPPTRYCPPGADGYRLRIVLQALDGWLAGAPYREIAVALFGQLRVVADWNDPRNHLRDRVRRAIRRGRALMTGSYLKLLR